MDEHFRVLGLRRGCQIDEVKSAYRSKALQLHPDRNPNGAEAFKRLQAAYEAVTQHFKRNGGQDGRLGGFAGSEASNNTAYFARGTAFNYARRTTNTTTPTPVPPHRAYTHTPSGNERHFTEEELFGNVRNSVPGGWQFNFSIFTGGGNTTSTNNNNSNAAAAGGSDKTAGNGAQRSAELHQRWSKLKETIGSKMNGDNNAGNVSYEAFRAQAEEERMRREAQAAAAAEEEARQRRRREAETAAAAAELAAWQRYMQDEEVNAQASRQRQTAKSETHRDALLHERRMLRRMLLQQRYVPEPADVQAMSDADVYTLLTIYRKLVPVLDNLLAARMTRTPCSRCGQVEKRASSGSVLVCHHACLCGTCAQLALECPLCGAARVDAPKTNAQAATAARAAQPPTGNAAGSRRVSRQATTATTTKTTTTKNTTKTTQTNVMEQASKQDSLNATASSSVVSSTHTTPHESAHGEDACEVPPAQTVVEEKEATEETAAHDEKTPEVKKAEEKKDEDVADVHNAAPESVNVELEVVPLSAEEKG